MSALCSMLGFVMGATFIKICSMTEPRIWVGVVVLGAFVSVTSIIVYKCEVER